MDQKIIKTYYVGEISHHGGRQVIRVPEDSRLVNVTMYKGDVQAHFEHNEDGHTFRPSSSYEFLLVESDTPFSKHDLDGWHFGVSNTRDDTIVFIFWRELE